MERAVQTIHQCRQVMRTEKRTVVYMLLCVFKSGFSAIVYCVTVYMSGRLFYKGTLVELEDDVVRVHIEVYEA